MAADNSGGSKVQLGSDVTVGTNTLAVSAGTDCTEKTHVLVYTKNAVGLQTTPVAIALVDGACGALLAAPAR